MGDGGTDGDASDDPLRPTPLDALGGYMGTLMPPIDSDWYTAQVNADDPRCVEALVRGSAGAEVALAAGPDPAGSIRRDVAPGQEVAIGLAVPGLPSILLGVESPRGSVLRGGSYLFWIHARNRAELGPGDAGTGSDAGSTATSAVEIEGSCLGGTLTPQDTVDLYRFGANAGDRVTISLAHTGPKSPTVWLLSPSGYSIQAVRAGERADVILGQAGAWHLKTTAALSGEPDTAQVDYVIGFSPEHALADDPPCRPHCS